MNETRHPWVDQDDRSYALSKVKSAHRAYLAAWKGRLRVELTAGCTDPQSRAAIIARDMGSLR